MRKLLSLTIPILFILACSGKPSIQFTHTKHNFGNQKQNIHMTHIFKFKNVGIGTLTITKVTAG